MTKLAIHISDLHVRTTQHHEMYKKQFEAFLDEIRKVVDGLSVNEVRFVITGDIVHQKISISNEQLMLTSWFLNELSKIGYVVIIPGNHDFLENNTDRVDSISPIVEMLSNDHIMYFKEHGVYPDDNINWVVYSLFQQNARPNFVKTPDKLHIGLFHGQVQGVSTDLGFVFEDGYDKLNFLGCDLVLCGDIHKRQTFDLADGKKGYMVGNMIQQGHGETIKHHGYGIYNVEENKYTYHDLPIEQPFMHFRINDINDIIDGKEVLVNLG